jgi:hypothetical protein
MIVSLLGLFPLVIILGLALLLQMVIWIHLQVLVQ